MIDSPDAPLRALIRRSLLRWFDRHGRDLPWRRGRVDAYGRWVSEIMLQQTQVETVIPYFNRFMLRFPDVRTLAAARQESVLRIWQGLGYYRRAIHLHRAAKAIMSDGGSFPQTVDDWMTLPGIGRYTAGAIASTACGARAAVVDGNVARVFARLFNIHDDVTKPATMKRLWSIAEALIPRKRCGDFNEALMDLGAMVCTPAAPRCAQCPLDRMCEARRKGTADELPHRGATGRVRDVRCVVAVVRRGDSCLLRRRPEGGLWGGLWEFPNVEFSRPETRSKAMRNLIAVCGITPEASVENCGRVSHRLSHRLMQFDVYRVDGGGTGVGAPPDRAWRWVRTSQLGRSPVSTATRKIVRLVNAVEENSTSIPGLGRDDYGGRFTGRRIATSNRTPSS